MRTQPPINHRFTAADRRAIIADYLAVFERGEYVRQEDFCAQHKITVATLSNWLRRDYTGPKLWREVAEELRKAKRRTNPERHARADQSELWQTSGTLIAVLGSIASLACADVAYAFHAGWLDAETLAFRPLTQAQRVALNKQTSGSTKRPTPKEAREALAFLLSPEANALCETVNALIGQPKISPDYLLRTAHRMARELANEGKLNRRDLPRDQPLNAAA